MTPTPPAPVTCLGYEGYEHSGRLFSPAATVTDMPGATPRSTQSNSRARRSQVFGTGQDPRTPMSSVMIRITLGRDNADRERCRARVSAASSQQHAGARHNADRSSGHLSLRAVNHEFVISSQFKKDTDLSKWNPRPCEIPVSPRKASLEG